jgi:phosphoribosylaminoimidazole carboxylase (NCAIR synthetase)
MVHVVFVAPRFAPNSNRYLKAFADLEGVTLSVVSTDVESALPEALRGRIAGHYRVADALDPTQLTVAVRAIARAVAPVDRLTCILEELQLALAETRAAAGIEGMGPEVARNFRDKDRMKAVLRARGVPVARSVLCRDAGELAAAIATVGFPAIVKPQAGLGARATYRIADADDLAALARQGVVPSPARPLQVEEFVRAREHTCETVSVRGVPVWRSGTRYFPGPLEVLETPWVQYCVLLPREEDDPTWTRFHPVNGAALEALFGAEAGSATGTALTHMEWFLKEDGSCLVNEVGARPPGVHIMPLMGLAHDFDMFAAWAELIALDRFAPRPRRAAAGAAFFRGQGSGGHVASVEGVERAAAEVGAALVELRAPRVGQPRAAGYEGEGWALVKHDTTFGAKAALQTLVERVQVRYG